MTLIVRCYTCGCPLTYGILLNTVLQISKTPQDNQSWIWGILTTGGCHENSVTVFMLSLGSFWSSRHYPAVMRGVLDLREMDQLIVFIKFSGVLKQHCVVFRP